MGSFEWMELQALTSEIDASRERLSAAKRTGDAGRAVALQEQIRAAEGRRERLLRHISTNLVSDSRAAASAPSAPPPGVEPPEPTALEAAARAAEHERAAPFDVSNGDKPPLGRSLDHTVDRVDSDAKNAGAALAERAAVAPPKARSSRDSSSRKPAPSEAETPEAAAPTKARAVPESSARRPPPPVAETAESAAPAPDTAQSVHGSSPRKPSPSKAAIPEPAMAASDAAVVPKEPGVTEPPAPDAAPPEPEAAAPNEATLPEEPGGAADPPDPDAAPAEPEAAAPDAAAVPEEAGSTELAPAAETHDGSAVEPGAAKPATPEPAVAKPGDIAVPDKPGDHADRAAEDLVKEVGVERPAGGPAGSETTAADNGVLAAAADTAAFARAPKADSAEGGINVWEQLKPSDFERARRDLDTRRAEMLARHAEELKALEADQTQLDTLEQAIAAFAQKFSGAGRDGSGSHEAQPHSAG